MVRPAQPQPVLVTWSCMLSLLRPATVSGNDFSISFPICSSTPSIACCTAYLASLRLFALKAVSADVRFSFTSGGADTSPPPPLLEGLPYLVPLPLVPPLLFPEFPPLL